MYLHEKIDNYEKDGRYPMHMPGHKRRSGAEPYAGDLTEIAGFDNLHHSEDILKSDREKAAGVYGAGEARFLVNGSTCGVLAAIGAVTEYGDLIVMGRNSHKSAYHAVSLRNLRAAYVYPDPSLYGAWSIDGPIPPEEVRGLLERREPVETSEKKDGFSPSPEKASAGQGRVSPAARKTAVSAVFITSPTYEGVISDVREIAKICHEYGVPLIVDEAHGAHLKAAGICEDAVEAGADIVIVGLHKTMPVLTQGALLTVSREAVRTGRVSMKALDDELGIYETSSPSYVLMGSISRCIHWLDGGCAIDGKTVRESAAAYREMLCGTRERLQDMRHLRLFPGKETGCGFAFDPGKLVISTKNTGLTGAALADLLRDSYRIEVEMASADYIIAMTSMSDTEEGLRGFADAVCACDEGLDEKFPAGDVAETGTAPCKFPEVRSAMTIGEAVALARRSPEKTGETDLFLLSEREERELVCADFVYVYPPGIPILAPGEIITKRVAKKIISDYNSGCALIGCAEREGRILVRYFRNF